MDRAQHWDDADPDVRRWIDDVVVTVTDTVPQPIAVVLHGSLAMGCYRRARSDVDLLVVADGALADGDRRALAVRLLAVADRRPTPGGIELSVVERAVATAPRHPVPYGFHLSDRWVDHVRAGGSGPHGTDPDLAAHFAVARARGVSLVGPPPATVIGEVPMDDIVASVRADIHGTLADGLAADPVSGVLNMCRTLSLLAAGQLLSKEEGGVWALGAVPAPHRPVVAAALAGYRTGTTEDGWDEHALAAFAAWADI